MFDLMPITVRTPIDDKDLRAIITRNVGEVVGDSFWSRVDRDPGALPAAGGK